jgi:hypothetical protein
LYFKKGKEIGKDQEREYNIQERGGKKKHNGASC